MSFPAVFASNTSKLLPPKQVLSQAWHDRTSVLQPGVNLFCWQRPPIPPITAYLSEVVQQQPERIHLPITMGNLGKQLKKARKAWPGQATEQAALFWHDVQQLSHDFLQMANCNQGQLHLRVVDNDACTKFHVDCYKLRLFTTYYGKGTEWLPESAVNRAGLGKSNEQIVKDPTQVQRLQAFEVGILKGEAPNSLDATKGIVHRSPAIEHAHEKRIILRIDL